MPVVTDEFRRRCHSRGEASGGTPFSGAARQVHREDMLLTGLEASLMNLQVTELVILSACDTGAGEVKIGDGVMSLCRAFRMAGAQTALANHWKVNDNAASQLMTEFIRRLWLLGLHIQTSLTARRVGVESLPAPPSRIFLLAVSRDRQ